MRKTILAFVLFAMVGSVPLVGQQEEREQERREEVKRRLETARAQLERALEQIRAANTDSARREIVEAIAAMRAAQRELADRYRVFADRKVPGGVSVYSYGARAPQVAVFGDDRPRIGVLVRTDRDDETDRIGAVLTAVTPGGPAEEAGLMAGDIITEANGVALAARGRGRDENPGQRLIEIVGDLEEGEELRVSYQRGGETHTAVLAPRVLASDAFADAFGDSVFAGDLMRRDLMRGFERFDPSVFAPRVEELKIAPIEMIARIGLPHRWLDIELVTLDEDLGSYFGTTEGVLVIRAPGDDDLGLKSGDVILVIDGRKPKSPSHALRILRSYEEGETVSMQIMRNGSQQRVTITVPENDRDSHRER
jgi:membrane-associated protease RseP (regulator of RpoE activity)